MANLGDLDDIAKKTGADEVLNTIVNKLKSLDGLAQGTELGESLKGFSDIQKTVLAPFKQITSSMKFVKESFNKFIDNKDKDKEKKPNNNNQNTNNEDYAKDQSVIDISEQIRKLIEGEQIGTEKIENQLSNQQYFLEDIQTTVAQLIYGTDKVVDQLKKNQKNTKVFQMAKKEMTLAEKAELQQGATQIAVLNSIREELVNLDNDLTNKINESIDPDYTFENLAKDQEKEKMDQKIPDPEEDKKKDQEKEKIGIFRRLGRFITLGTKFMLHSIRAAIAAAAKVLLILAGILAAVVAIDLLQAIIRARFDDISNWCSKLWDSITDGWNNAKEWMSEIIKEYISKPIDKFSFYFTKIENAIINLQNKVLEAFADLVGVFSKDKEKRIREFIDKRKALGQIKEQREWDEFQKKYGEEEAKKHLGERIEIEKYEAQKEDKNSIKNQAEIDKNSNPDVVTEIDKDLLVQMNQNTDALQNLVRELRSTGKEEDLQKAEKIEAIIETKKMEDEYAKEAREKVEFSNWNPFNWWKSDEEKAQNKKEADEAELNARKEFQKMMKENDIKPTDPVKLKNQISEKERQEMMYYGAPAIYHPSFKDNKEPSSNVQMNNQQNTTNVIQQPLSTVNPASMRRSRTNIGQE